jgi:phosphatidylglycerophosphatase C
VTDPLSDPLPDPLPDPPSDPHPTPVVIAAFDFDGTLTRSDSVVPFLRRFLWRWAALEGIVRCVPAGLVAVARRDRDSLRLAATSALLRGVPAVTVEQCAASFAAEIVSARLRPDTTARLRWHLSQGHRVLFVSASYDSYLLPVAQHVGAEAVLSTRLEIGADGRCSGGLIGANCRGPEKARRLHEWLKDQGMDRASVTVWAYGDSKGDRELLADADHAVWAQTSLGSLPASPHAGDDPAP